MTTFEDRPYLTFPAGNQLTAQIGLKTDVHKGSDMASDMYSADFVTISAYFQTSADADKRIRTFDCRKR